MGPFELPMLFALLTPQTPPIPPAARPNRPCTTSHSQEALDCCLHLAGWTGRPPLFPIITSFAQSREHEERTTQDVTKR